MSRSSPECNLYNQTVLGFSSGVTNYEMALHDRFNLMLARRRWPLAERHSCHVRTRDGLSHRGFCGWDLPSSSTFRHGHSPCRVTMAPCYWWLPSPQRAPMEPWTPASLIRWPVAFLRLSADNSWGPRPPCNRPPAH